MGKFLQFPSAEYIEEVLEVKKEIEKNYFEKIQRINALNRAVLNDSGMIKQIKGNWEELGRNKYGAKKFRNEDESIDCYASYIQEEKKKRGVNFSNSNQIVTELENCLNDIIKLRRKFWSTEGLYEDESLKIGALKRNFRSLLVYYIKAKENLIEVENNIRGIAMVA